MKDLLIFLADGFEEIEALTVCDYLRRAELEVDLVSITENREVKGVNGINVLADKTISEITKGDYRALYTPGGGPGAKNLAKDEVVIDFVKTYNSENKLTAAICAAPLVFDRAQILNKGKFTCYPGYEANLKQTGRIETPIVYDENIVTSMGPSTAQVLAFELIKILKNEESAESIKKAVLFDRLVGFIKEDIVN